MLLRQYVEHVNFSAALAKEITELFRSPVRLVNLLLRPSSESPVPCHTEMRRCLVEAYPYIDDVEGGSFFMAPVGCFAWLNNGAVLDLILEVLSNTESQMPMAATVDLITRDSRSNFVMKVALGFISSFLRMSGFGLPGPSHFV